LTGRLDPAVAAVRRCVRTALRDLLPGDRVLVACSGGADSLALAAATVFEGVGAGWDVGAVVVDHQQQPGSAEVAARVAQLLEQLGCEPVEVVPVELGSGNGPEGSARVARYAALTAAAQRHHAVVALGHTRDDQAETVLLGLVRGSGLRSLAGMPARAGIFYRPLLDLTRDQTRQACRALELPVWDDPHNADSRFLRVRVRREVLPLMERLLGPGVAAALARTARLARADADALDAFAEDISRAALTDTGALSVGVLATTLPALRRRVLRSAAVTAGSPAGGLFAVHIDALERLVTNWHGQQGVDLPGPVRAYRSGGLLFFESVTGGEAASGTMTRLDDRESALEG
jgi:tRNA(Ile)-lysidine synthase